MPYMVEKNEILPETLRSLRLRGTLPKHKTIRPPDLPLQLLHRYHAIGPEVLAAIQEKQHTRYAGYSGDTDPPFRAY